jgi:hypothetical protein
MRSRDSLDPRVFRGEGGEERRREAPTENAAARGWRCGSLFEAHFSLLHSLQ